MCHPPLLKCQLYTYLTGLIKFLKIVLDPSPPSPILLRQDPQKYKHVCIHIHVHTRVHIPEQTRSGHLQICTLTSERTHTSQQMYIQIRMDPQWSHRNMYMHVRTYIHIRIDVHTNQNGPAVVTQKHVHVHQNVHPLKLKVSFAEYPFFYRALLQKRPIILSSLLTHIRIDTHINQKDLQWSRTNVYIYIRMDLQWSQIVCHQ